MPHFALIFLSIRKSILLFPGKKLVSRKVKIQANGISSNVAFSLSVAVTKIKLITITNKSNFAVCLLSE